MDGEVVVTTTEEIDDRVGKTGCVCLIIGLIIGLIISLIIGLIIGFPSYRWEKRGEVIEIEGELYQTTPVKKTYSTIGEE